MMTGQIRRVLRPLCLAMSLASLLNCKDAQAPCAACELIAHGVQFGMSAKQVLDVRPNARISPYIGLAESRPDSTQYVFTNSSGEDVWPDRDAKQPPKGKLSLIRLLRVSVTGNAAIDSVDAWNASVRSQAHGAPACSHAMGGRGDRLQWRTVLSDGTTLAATVYTPQEAMEFGGAFLVVIELAAPSRYLALTRAAPVPCDEAAARVVGATTLPEGTGPS